MERSLLSLFSKNKKKSEVWARRVKVSGVGKGSGEAALEKAFQGPVVGGVRGKSRVRGHE